MKQFVRSTLFVLVAGAIAAASGAGAARGIGGGLNNGPIIITGPIDCERDLVYQCKWVGRFYVCGWVPGPCRTF